MKLPILQRNYTAFIIITIMHNILFIHTTPTIYAILPTSYIPNPHILNYTFSAGKRKCTVPNQNSLLMTSTEQDTFEYMPTFPPPLHLYGWLFFNIAEITHSYIHDLVYTFVHGRTGYKHSIQLESSHCIYSSD